jgi:NTE family protein
MPESDLTIHGSGAEAPVSEKLALVFSGGGAKGAFGVGVLAEMVARAPALSWHIVTGTSTGSLIAPLAAAAAADRRYVDTLLRLYGTVREKDVAESNVKGIVKIIKAIVNLPEGLANLGPLARLIDRTITPDLLAGLQKGAVSLVIPAVNLQEGSLALCTQDGNVERIKQWYARNETDGFRTPLEFWPFAELRRVMVASSAEPVTSDPVKFRDAQYVDGGVFDLAPLRQALASGATDAIVVLMSPPPPTPVRKNLGNLVEIGLRAVDLLQDEVVRGDVNLVHAAAALSAPGVRYEAAPMPPGSRLSTYMRSGAAVTPVLVEPELALGETMDFDSRVQPTWPEKPEGNAPAISIMEARIAYGRRVAAALLQQKDSDLSRVVARYSARSPAG